MVQRWWTRCAKASCCPVYLHLAEHAHATYHGRLKVLSSLLPQERTYTCPMTIELKGQRGLQQLQIWAGLLLLDVKALQTLWVQRLLHLSVDRAAFNCKHWLTWTPMPGDASCGLVAEHPESAQSHVLHLLQHHKVHFNLQACLSKALIVLTQDERLKFHRCCVDLEASVRHQWKLTFTQEHMSEDAAMFLEPPQHHCCAAQHSDHRGLPDVPG